MKKIYNLQEELIDVFDKPYVYREYETHEKDKDGSPVMKKVNWTLALAIAEALPARKRDEAAPVLSNQVIIRRSEIARKLYKTNKTSLVLEDEDFNQVQKYIPIFLPQQAAGQALQMLECTTEEWSKKKSELQDDDLPTVESVTAAEKEAADAKEAAKQKQQELAK